MNSQYLQWITGPKRGEIESIEMMQDGQTFEDVVIMSNGRKSPISNIGKDFIILPDRRAALSQLDLDIMYPKQNNKPQRQAVKKEHRDIMGIDEPEKEAPAAPAKKRNSSFASDLLERSKKTDQTISVDVKAQMPTQAFFDMMNQTFDEQTADEVIEIILDSINHKEIRTAMKESILKFYGGQ